MKNLILIFSLIVFVSCTGQKNADTKTVRVSNQEWKDRIAQESDPMLVDVRTPQEFDAGHIPGAVNIDFLNDEFMSNMTTLEKERTLFVYCQSGGRSAKACAKLETAGFTDLIELREGYSKWEP